MSFTYSPPDINKTRRGRRDADKEKKDYRARILVQETEAWGDQTTTEQERRESSDILHACMEYKLLLYFLGFFCFVPYANHPDPSPYCCSNDRGEPGQVLQEERGGY